MKLIRNILSVLFCALLLVIITAGVYLFFLYRELQRTPLRDAYQNPEIIYEEEEEIRISDSLISYFYAVEYLLTNYAYSGSSSDDTQFRVLQKMDPEGITDLSSLPVYLEFMELFNDPGFMAYLNSVKLVLVQEPLEDFDFAYFDFITFTGIRIGSIGLQKLAGRAYLFDREYISLGAVQTLEMRSSGSAFYLPPDFSSFLPDPFDVKSNHVVLLVGTDMRLTDTLILAILNEDDQSADLFSLPRDLFYNNLKINEYYNRYGAETLVRVVGEITGFEIDNYIIIDMYAFIDVINILGGITINLESPIVDPTYRVRDNGVWSTIFYPAGTHHLYGIEALRVARSRHFISDFGRAYHQQLILSAIINQVGSLGIFDLGRVHELAMMFLRYVETDYSPIEILRNIMRFSSLSVRSQNVLSTANVLFFTYSNLRYLGLDINEVEPDFYLGAYILLPAGENWSLIHNFIRYSTEGITAETEETEEIDLEETIPEETEPIS